MNLRELQQAFQQHVVAGDSAVAPHIQATAHSSVEARLAVYSDAYRLRLAEALAQNYPRLQQWLGTDAFERLACDYIDARPSAQPSIRWFGAHLADLLGDQPVFAAQPWVAELARWEWAIATAFDAADAGTIDEQALAACTPEHWPTLRFRLHGWVQLMLLETNAVQIFKALAQDAAPPPGQRCDPPLAWLIWRSDLAPRYRSVEPDEAAALRTVMEGGTFGQVCDTLSEWHEATSAPLRAARLLKTWLHDGMLTGVVIADPGS